MKVEVIKGQGGWYWRLLAKNGKILAHSEIYATKASALRTAKKIFYTEMDCIEIIED